MSYIWQKIEETNDYIVAEGTSGIWTWRKWNSGIAECWGGISSKPTSNGNNNQAVSLPFDFIHNSSTSYLIQLMARETGHMVTQIMDCDVNGNLVHSTKSFTFRYKCENPSLYTVCFACSVIGKWK